MQLLCSDCLVSRFGDQKYCCVMEAAPCCAARCADLFPPPYILSTPPPSTLHSSAAGDEWGAVFQGVDSLASDPLRQVSVKPLQAR